MKKLPRDLSTFETLINEDYVSTVFALICTSTTDGVKVTHKNNFNPQ